MKCDGPYPNFREKPKWSCIDCGRDNPGFFWVKDSVWKEAGFQKYNDGIICLQCFVSRLKRPLIIDDLDDSGPCSNDALHYMFKLGNRPTLRHQFRVPLS